VFTVTNILAVPGARGFSYELQ